MTIIVGEHVRSFRRMWMDGATAEDMADRFQCSISCIHETRRRLGLPARKFYGPRHKCVNRDKKILAMIEAGKTFREVADAMGCSRGAVSGVVYRARHGINQSEPRPFYAMREEVPVMKEDKPDPVVICEPKEPWQCAEPGCRNTRQPGRRHCAEHNPVSARKRVDHVAAEVAA